MHAMPRICVSRIIHACIRRTIVLEQSTAKLCQVHTYIKQQHAPREDIAHYYNQKMKRKKTRGSDHAQHKTQNTHKRPIENVGAGLPKKMGGGVGGQSHTQTNQPKTLFAAGTNIYYPRLHPGCSSLLVGSTTVAARSSRCLRPPALLLLLPPLF